MQRPGNSLKRRVVLKGSTMKTRLLALPLALLLTAQASAAAIDVMKSPNCGCCAQWVEYLKKRGFAVNVTETDDMDALKDRLRVPDAVRSCHTAKVGKYVVEGHVPVEDIERLLNEKPDAIGIAVAGMPMGAPGMEHGSHKEPYKTVLITAKGQKLFAQH
jgi:hypothetical protein